MECAAGIVMQCFGIEEMTHRVARLIVYGGRYVQLNS
jgi:hypothetical protein